MPPPVPPHGGGGRHLGLGVRAAVEVARRPPGTRLLRAGLGGRDQLVAALPAEGEGEQEIVL